MGLDMTYGLRFDNDEDLERFDDLLQKSFQDSNDFYSGDDYVSIYYRLNWSGVRREKGVFVNKIVSKFCTPSNNIIDDKKYLYLENRSFKLKTDEDETTNFLYSVDDVQEIMDSEFKFPFNPVDLLSLGFWHGSNGETFTLSKADGFVILTPGRDEDSNNGYSPQDTNVLLSISFEEFEEQMSKSISFIKESLIDMDDEYLNIKSREVLFVLKYFMYNDVELFVDMF